MTFILGDHAGGPAGRRWLHLLAGRPPGQQQRGSGGAGRGGAEAAGAGVIGVGARDAHTCAHRQVNGPGNTGK